MMTFYYYKIITLSSSIDSRGVHHAHIQPEAPCVHEDGDDDVDEDDSNYKGKLASHSFEYYHLPMVTMVAMSSVVSLCISLVIMTGTMMMMS